MSGLRSKQFEERFQQFPVPHGTVALWEPEAGALLAERSIEAVMAAALASSKVTF